MRNASEGNGPTGGRAAPLFFAGLPPGEVADFMAQAPKRTAGAGRYLFHEGEPANAFYVLLAGQVRLTQLTAEGRQVIVRLVGPGEVFGGVLALGDTVYPVSAQAVGRCDLMAWDAERAMAMLERHPKLALNVLRVLAFRIRDLQDRYRELATERVERRIAHALLRLARQTGRRTEEGVLIDTPLTRKDLAEMTGTTLYTVSRTLSRWEQAGLVALGRSRLTILNPHGLVNVAEDLPPSAALP
jgi:CRP-like cAMP-binding protein